MFNKHNELKNIRAAAQARDHSLSRRGARQVLGSKTKWNDSYVFDKNGFKVKPFLPGNWGDIYNERMSPVHFTPQLDRRHSAIGRTRSRTSEFLLGAIDAIQNFVLLVDAEHIEKPDYLIGSTNNTMGNIAKRVGFVSIKGNSGGVIVPFEDFAEHVFSPEMSATKELLEKRIQNLAR